MLTHNPEVVGSSPASATIKRTGFRLKSGSFSNFLYQNESQKNSDGVSFGVSPKMGKIKNRRKFNFFSSSSSLLFETGFFFRIIQNRDKLVNLSMNR